MSDHRAIRNAFIRKYAEAHERMRDSGWQMITERDKAHRALNQESGWSEPDGTFGIGCKSCVDEEYKRRYDEIEDRFRGTYDSNLPAFYNWCRSQEITIFELLFFERNIRVMQLSMMAGAMADVSISASDCVANTTATFFLRSVLSQLRILAAKSG